MFGRILEEFGNVISGEIEVATFYTLLVRILVFHFPAISNEQLYVIISKHRFNI